jgi:hypothetical protein
MQWLPWSRAHERFAGAVHRLQKEGTTAEELKGKKSRMCF